MFENGSEEVWTYVVPPLFYNQMYLKINYTCNHVNINNNNYVLKYYLRFLFLIYDPKNLVFVCVLQTTPRLFCLCASSGVFEGEEQLSLVRMTGAVMAFPFLQENLYSAKQPGKTYIICLYHTNTVSTLPNTSLSLKSNGSMALPFCLCI